MGFEDLGHSILGIINLEPIIARGKRIAIVIAVPTRAGRFELFYEFAVAVEDIYDGALLKSEIGYVPCVMGTIVVWGEKLGIFEHNGY